MPDDVERDLLAEVTDLLLLHEGVDPTNEAARKIAWVFVHRPEVYAAGAPTDVPHYRFILRVPEGQYNDERREAVTKAITDAVAKAEADPWPNPAFRVWVFTWEVPDGTWGGLGHVVRLPDIAAFVDPALREGAEKHLAARRRKEALAMLEAAGERPAALA